MIFWCVRLGFPTCISCGLNRLDGTYGPYRSFVGSSISKVISDLFVLSFFECKIPGMGRCTPPIVKNLVKFQKKSLKNGGLFVRTREAQLQSYWCWF